MRHPRQVGEVRLQGLEVKIPPGDDDDKEDGKSDADKLAQARKLEQVIIDRFEAPDTVDHADPEASRQAAEGLHRPSSRDGSAGDQSDDSVHRHADEPRSERTDRNIRYLRTVERGTSGAHAGRWTITFSRTPISIPSPALPESCVRQAASAGRSTGSRSRASPTRRIFRLMSGERRCR